MRCLALLLLCCLAFSQERANLDRSKMCHFYPVRFNEALHLFPPDRATVTFIENILKRSELTKNFEIKAANVPNAAAVIDRNVRYILYAQGFLHDIAQKTGTQWAATSIMAHEIAHHLNADTLGSTAPRAEQELAADKFAGNVLHRMGATLPQAKAAIEAMPDQPPTPEYPPKSARIAAVVNGWLNASDNVRISDSGRSINSPQPSEGSDNDESARLRAERLRLERERLERERIAEERRAAAERKHREQEEEEEAERRREEAAERRREQREERERKRREREEERETVGRGCYDVWGNRRCVLVVAGEIGGPCTCLGVPGVGVIGR